MKISLNQVYMYCTYIHTSVLPQIKLDKSRKLIITKDIPLTAFYESVLKMTYVDTEVLHAELSYRC